MFKYLVVLNSLFVRKNVGIRYGFIGYGLISLIIVDSGGVGGWMDSWM